MQVMDNSNSSNTNMVKRESGSSRKDRERNGGSREKNKDRARNY
jgi:hypothetical protein